MSNLVKLIGYLLQSPTPIPRELKGGLTLAYTPPAANKKNPGHGRLTLSRVRSVPSVDEVAIVTRDLKAALGNQRRYIDGQLWESPVRQHGTRNYVVLEWREVEQGELL